METIPCNAAEADRELLEKKCTAIWVARSLFERGKTSGSSANLSFLHQGKLYITAGSTCFGRLTENDFACLSMTGENLGERNPSKEWPLHLQVYRFRPGTEAVIHTHSTYSVLWSFVRAEDEKNCIPENTPYLRMKVGRVGLISYEKPGSQELFDAFAREMEGSDAWILKQHGPVVPGNSILDAFYGLEELEESAKIAWELRKSQLL